LRLDTEARLKIKYSGVPAPWRLDEEDWNNPPILIPNFFVICLSHLICAPEGW
jgi:hypothetical protein